MRAASGGWRSLHHFHSPIPPLATPLRIFPSSAVQNAKATPARSTCFAMTQRRVNLLVNGLCSSSANSRKMFTDACTRSFEVLFRGQVFVSQQSNSSHLGDPTVSLFMEWHPMPLPSSCQLCVCIPCHLCKCCSQHVALRQHLFYHLAVNIFQVSHLCFGSYFSCFSRGL